LTLHVSPDSGQTRCRHLPGRKRRDDGTEVALPTFAGSRGFQ
jgi:hypothetical protein